MGASIAVPAQRFQQVLAGLAQRLDQHLARSSADDFLAQRVNDRARLLDRPFLTRETADANQPPEQRYSLAIMLIRVVKYARFELSPRRECGAP
jgi:hypothetical protein